MTFLAPWVLLGLLGVSLPILAHRFGREHPRLWIFPALRFARPIEPTSSQTTRVRDPLLLVIRIAIVSSLALALARPATVEHDSLGVIAQAHDSVVLLDTSASMGTIVDRRTELSRAHQRLGELVRALPAGSRVGLLTSDPLGPALDPTSSTEQVLTTLDAWLGEDEANVRPIGGGLSERVPEAAAMLRSLGSEARTPVIYAFSDATAGGLGGLPRTDGEVRVLPVPTRNTDSEPPNLSNWSIESVEWTPAPEIDANASLITARVRRFGGAETGERSAALSLLVDDTEVARTEVTAIPDQVTVAEFTHTLERTGIPTAAEIRLVDMSDDPLACDDRRAFWLAGRRALRIMVIDGDPSDERARDEIFFLSTALSSSFGDRRAEIVGLTPDQLDERLRNRGEASLADIDVMISANSRPPSAEVAPILIERVRNGMGLWLTVGDRVEPAETNGRLGPLLPLLLREAIFTGTAPGLTQARGELLADPLLGHPIFAGRNAKVDLTSARADRIFLLEPDAKRSPEIALSWARGAPALLTTQFGSGRVALLTTTLDRDWSDLALRPGFVGLVEQTVDWLGGVGKAGAVASRGVGEVVRFDAHGPVEVLRPGDAPVPLAPDEHGVIEFKATDRPGHYSVRPRDTEDPPNSSDVFAVQIDPRESDIRPVDWVPSDEALESVDIAHQQPNWHRWVLLALALLGLESAIRARPIQPNRSANSR